MTRTEEYAGPYTRRRALARSQAMLIAMARKRGQRYNTDASKGPIGIPPGKPVGKGRHCDPAIGYATHAVPAERTRMAGEFLIRVTREAKELPDSTERLPDGTDVEVTKAGTVRAADTWLAEEEVDVERTEVVTKPTR